MPRIDQESMRKLLKLYFIMGSINCSTAPAQVLREAIRGGITLFQFREKGTGALTGSEKYKLAEQLQEECRNSKIPFLVNDDVDLALALDADGVHIGQKDESALHVRGRIVDKILGVSANTLDEAMTAVEQGADYLGVGPVFPTTTKEDIKAIYGLDTIRSFRENGILLPIVGIGGIAAGNAGSVIEAGADGISVITAISRGDSPEQNARALLQQVNKPFFRR